MNICVKKIMKSIMRDFKKLEKNNSQGKIHIISSYYLLREKSVYIEVKM